MKQLKKPTRSQKVMLQSRKLNPADWLIERDTPEKMVLDIGTSTTQGESYIRRK